MVTLNWMLVFATAGFSEVHLFVFEVSPQPCAGTFDVQGIVKEEAYSQSEELNYLL